MLVKPLTACSDSLGGTGGLSPAGDKMRPRLPSTEDPNSETVDRIDQNLYFAM